jgi:hypothetical protein
MGIIKMKESLIVFDSKSSADEFPFQALFSQDLVNHQGRYFLELVKAMSIAPFNANANEESEREFSTTTPKELVSRAHQITQQAYTLLEQSGWVIEGNSLGKLQEIYLKKSCKDD